MSWRPGVSVSQCPGVPVSWCLGVPVSGSQRPGVPVFLFSRTPMLSLLSSSTPDRDINAQPAFIQQARLGHQCLARLNPASQTGAPTLNLVLVQPSRLGHQCLACVNPASQTSTPMLSSISPSKPHRYTNAAACFHPWVQTRTPIVSLLNATSQTSTPMLMLSLFSSKQARPGHQCLAGFCPASHTETPMH